MPPSPTSNALAQRAVRDRSLGARAVAAVRRATKRILFAFSFRATGAAIVRESVSFFLREVVRPGGIRYYRLRENGLTIGLRHAALDSATLAEVFSRHDYVPAPEVAEALGRPRTILDLGANIGLFGAFAAPYWPQSTIVGYEPDPDNAAVHERTIAANRLQHRWRVVCAAAGSSDREVELAAGRAMGSFVVAPGAHADLATIRVAVRDVLPEVCAADLVKLDIEGGEWEILLDERFATSPPRALVLEYHPHLCPEPEPRAAAERALSRAGLTTAPIWHRDDGFGMLWAWRAHHPGADAP